MAIRDGKFTAVGSDAEVMASVGPQTNAVDLAGKPVTPGIIDGHCHALWLGVNLLCDVQLAHVRSAEDIVAAIGEAAIRKKPGEWIVTAPNWRTYEVKRYPSLAELDVVAPVNPVWVKVGAHRGFTNSLGLELAGITRDEPDPAGGTVVKDDTSGEPTGMLEESAQQLVTRLLPPVDRAKALDKACSFYNSLGVTGVQDEGVEPAEIAAYRTAKAAGKLTLRCGLMHMINPSQSREELSGIIRSLAGAGLGKHGDETLRVMGLKTFNETIVPMPGKPLWPTDYLREVLLEAAEAQLRVAIHSQAGATEVNLGLYEEVNRRFPIKHLRWAIVHQRFTTPDWVQLNKELGLVLNQDLAFGLISLAAVEKLRRAALPERLYCPLPLYIEAGVPFCLNSDGGGSSTELSVWSAMRVATHREGWPDFNPEYGISREQALRAITMGGAYKMMLEDKIGSIEVGKLADLAVLTADPLTCPGDELRDIKAEMTMVGGRVVYEH
ncbi:MAG: amidohydrolase family protein [Chloroflexi bacterium]|nr:amidohydrolase family protein [Chloroflexota bacterium]